MRAAEFETLVGEHFGFLEDQFGFKREALQDYGREFAVRFTGPVRVILSYEVGGGMFVTIWAAVPSPPHQATEFSLASLAQELERQNLYSRHKRPGETIAAQLQGEADLLREIGGDVLRGDVSVMVARAARYWSAVQHR